ncbi:hypothetical protein Bbelb_049530 [Branchiostoma belcheri]|nr:hypothetical protein Bbelb_049530 [Branchiostoma belcheri]
MTGCDREAPGGWPMRPMITFVKCDEGYSCYATANTHLAKLFTDFPTIPIDKHTGSSTTHGRTCRPDGNFLFFCEGGVKTIRRPNCYESSDFHQVKQNIAADNRTQGVMEKSQQELKRVRCCNKKIHSLLQIVTSYDELLPKLLR